MKKFFILIMALMVLLSSCDKISLEEDSGGQEIVREEEGDGPKENTVIPQALAEVLEEKKEVIYPAYEPVKVEAKVRPYEIAGDFSNIVNYMQDDYPIYSSDFVKEIMDKGFVISKSYYKQPFGIYEDNQYTYTPNFVTSDSVVHLYHVIYSGILKNLEENRFYEDLVEISKIMCQASLDDYNNNKGLIRELSGKNAAYFYLGLDLVDRTDGIKLPDEILDLVGQEKAQVETETKGASLLMDGEVDYSQFKARGHYTESEVLEKYFKLMMTNSQYGFLIKDRSGNINTENIIQSVLIAKNIMKDKEAYGKWQAINNPISFIVENSEDIKPEDIIKITAQKVDLENLDLLTQDAFVNYMVREIEKFPAPKIKHYEARGMRFMPQRAVIDNVWLQKLLDVNLPSQKPVVSGLELMGLLGNEMAEKLIDNDPNYKKWDEYKDKYQETKEEIASLDFEERTGNLYRSWLWMLESFNEKFGEGYPEFMQTERWEKKSLNTALASWAQLKHDTILYAKQFGAEMGGFDEIEVRHFVEPSVNVYERLIYLSEFTRLNLDNYGLLEGDQKVQLEAYQDMLEFLLACSLKELDDQVLSDDDNERLTYIGGEMENIFLAFDNTQIEEDEFGYEIPASDRDMAIVADLMTIPENTWNLPSGNYLEVGSGYPNTITVIYRVGDNYFIGTGSTMSYYEFLSDERLDDEDFRNKLNLWGPYMGEMNTETLEQPQWFDDLYGEYSY